MRPPDQRGGRPRCPPRPSPEAKILPTPQTLSRPQHPVEEIFPEIFPSPAPARDQALARLAERLADDPGAAVGAKRLAIAVQHRLRCGGSPSSHDAWLLRCIAARQRQAARRWAR